MGLIFSFLSYFSRLSLFFSYFLYLELFGKIQPGPSISKVALAIDPGGKNQFRFYSNNESKESQIVKEENNRFKS